MVFRVIEKGTEEFCRGGEIGRGEGRSLTRRLGGMTLNICGENLLSWRRGCDEQENDIPLSPQGTTSKNSEDLGAWATRKTLRTQREAKTVQVAAVRSTFIGKN